MATECSNGFWLAAILSALWHKNSNFDAMLFLCQPDQHFFGASFQTYLNCITII